jgi:hypothetical protein
MVSTTLRKQASMDDHEPEAAPVLAAAISNLHQAETELVSVSRPDIMRSAANRLASATARAALATAQAQLATALILRDAAWADDAEDAGDSTGSTGKHAAPGR